MTRQHNHRMDMEDSDRRVAWMLTLVRYWYGQPDNEEQPHGWPQAPRHITAIAGRFDAPSDSDNDPVAALAMTVAAIALDRAKYRANLLVFALLIAQNANRRFSYPYSRESLYPRPSRSVATLPVLFSWLCQISHLPTPTTR